MQLMEKAIVAVTIDLKQLYFYLLKPRPKDGGIVRSGFKIHGNSPENGCHYLLPAALWRVIGIQKQTDHRVTSRFMIKY